MSEEDSVGRAQQAIPREIRQELSFSREAQGLDLPTEELDERLLDITWMIARIPEISTRIREADCSVVDHDGKPPLRIFFRYDDSFVYLLDIEQLES